MAQWYVCPRQDANPQGPFTTEKLQRLAAAGRVKSDMWFSVDGGDWQQNPEGIFDVAPPVVRTAPAKPAPAKPATPRAVPAKAKAAPAAARSKAPRAASPKRGGAVRSRRSRGEQEAVEGEEGRPAAKPPSSPVAWVMAGVIVLLLGAAFVLDQWATTRVDISRLDKTVTLAIHYGRAEVTQAAEAAQLSRGVAMQKRSYESIGGDKADETAMYGMLLLALIALACVVRLVSAGMVTSAGAFKGGAATLYIVGTVLVGGVAIVAFLFNNGGVLSEDPSEILGLIGDNARHGFGISTWGAIGALVMDALGILMVKAGLTPRTRSARGGRGGRRVRR